MTMPLVPPLALRCAPSLALSRAIAEKPGQCFIAGPIRVPRSKAFEAMLDIPRDNEKSFAEGKILKSMTERVGVVTFNNPEKRNAMSLDMWEGLGQAFTELGDNPEGRVVILTGAGDKAFMSGADISQFEKNRHNAQASEEYSRKSEAQRALLANYP